ncbi:MAG: YicC/YloC family endoribonuclease [Bacteroidota bacterium]
MLKSMTGYGSASGTVNNALITVEIKTLNSKFLDANIRLSRLLADRELEIRTLLTDELARGKVSIAIELSNEQETELKQRYNEALFSKYFEELKKLAVKVGASDDELFKMALNSPDVIISDQGSSLNDAQWIEIKRIIREAVQSCNHFREKEGSELQQKFEHYITTIQSALESVEALDPKRIERIKIRIRNNLNDFVDQESLDKNRLEQELVYYIEKLDITEEKVRLKSHLDHFLEVLDHPQSSGKKLGFISQEIGREINTIGSKANDADIQKHVVSMKEELEKIKEQLLNVL